MTRPRRLLAVHFRDPAHPEAGGAELHLEEILAAAAAAGDDVTWLACGFAGAAPEDRHRGIRIVRRGAFWNFNFVAGGILRREFSRPAPDLVIEDINKVPCFAPWWTPSPVAVIVPHLFGTTAFREAHPLVALYVLALEHLIPLVYRRSRFVAISDSTREDLVRRGIPGDRVAVVHCGLDHATYRRPADAERAARPTIVFVGRLRRYKGLDWVLRALPAVRRRVADVRFEVIGDGPHAAPLRRLAQRLGIGDAVKFTGFLPRAEKVRRLQAAWVAVQPSPKEGWGLTVVEAAACGTAVVAADSPGLRDSVRHGDTGLLVPYGDGDALAAALAAVLADAGLRERLGRGGQAWAERFRWPECARRTLAALHPAAGGEAA